MGYFSFVPFQPSFKSNYEINEKNDTITENNREFNTKIKYRHLIKNDKSR